MYIEHLQTPHPLYGASGTDIQTPSSLDLVPLQDAAGIHEAAQYVAASPDYDTAAWEVTEHMQEVVHESLRFPSSGVPSKRRGETTFDTLLEEQVTNCLGYAAVASECLEAAGVDHYVTFANGHWLVSRPSDNHNRFWLVDMHSPRFSQEVTSVLSRGTPRALADQVATHGRGVAMLDTRIFAKTGNKTMEVLASNHPWTTIAKQGLLLSRSANDNEESRYITAHTLVMSVFAPKVGRQLLHNYVRFQNAVDHNNLTIASEELAAMHGLYPEIDARAPHGEIRRLIKNLCALGEFAQAGLAAEHYAASFSLTEDARLKELEGDMYRHISKASQDPEFAARSCEAYQQAANSTRRSSSKVLGKVAASNNLVQMLTDT
jgi:hypothetical protein